MENLMSYISSPWSFDVGERFQKNSSLTAIPASQYGTLSFWFKLAPKTTPRAIFRTNTNCFTINATADTNGKFGLSIIAKNYINGQVGYVSPVPEFDAGVWHHLCVSWASAVVSPGKGFDLFIDDVKYLKTIDTGSLASLTWNQTSQLSIGAAINGGTDAPGSYTEWWMMTGIWPNFTLDFDIEANRRKFIDTDKHPVDLGLNGELPTGISPILYLGSNAGFGVNRGMGGNFMVIGNVTTDPDLPYLVDFPIYFV